MKKLLVLMLAVALVVSVAGCSGGGTAGPSGTLVVGSPAISGNFLTGFGSSSYDVWVRDLINGLGTYAVTPEGQIVLNETVVKDLDVQTDGAGNKTYTFEIYNDMKFNDGTGIKAENYVFYMLWAASPQWVDAGATTAIGDGLLGYQAYRSGDTDRFAGVKLIDDYKFSFTIGADYLPYFYETSYVSITPMPMHVWAEGSEIDTNDSGSKITGVDLAAATETVAQTERFAPTVTAGAFKFVSFENNAVTVQANEHFKGTYDGKKPQLEFIIIRNVNQDTDVDQVINGEIDVVTGVIEGEKIDKARAASSTDVNYYPRNGYGGVYFHTDFGPVANPLVRHAMGYLLDRNEIIANVLGGYGSVTNGHYGLAQWMYQERKAQIDALPNFELDYERANELLDEAGWTFDADGGTFDPEKAGPDTGYYRYNEAGERLVIHHLGTEENNVTDNVELQFMQHTPYAGIEFTLTRSDFAYLLDHYYEGFLMGDEQKYHTFNLASNFGVAYDPYYSYHSSYADNAYYNPERVADAQLDELMVNMRSLEPTQTEEFLGFWLDYQKRWNEILPAIPLYSNQYYDVFGTHVQGFNTTPFVSWAVIACDIYIEN